MMNQYLILLSNYKYHYTSWKITKKNFIATHLQLAYRALFFQKEEIDREPWGSSPLGDH